MLPNNNPMKYQVGDKVYWLVNDLLCSGEITEALARKGFFNTYTLGTSNRKGESELFPATREGYAALMVKVMKRSRQNLQALKDQQEDEEARTNRIVASINKEFGYAD